MLGVRQVDLDREKSFDGRRCLIVVPFDILGLMLLTMAFLRLIYVALMYNQD